MTSHPDILPGFALGKLRESPGLSGEALLLSRVETPVGPGWIGRWQDTVVWLSLGPLDEEAIAGFWKGPVSRHDFPAQARKPLEDAIFGKVRIGLTLIGTEFQSSVWEALLQIPFAETITYQGLASALGDAKKTRAVASAVGANPIAWLVPCHRVVSSDGSLGGYRWGPGIKEALLTWENLRRHDMVTGVSPVRRERLESILHKAQRFEEIANMSGDIAHDLNNLIAPIRMATELLKRNLEDDPKGLDRYIGIIDSSTQRARSVIQEILAFAREKEIEDHQHITLRPLLEELEHMIRETFPKEIEFGIDYGSDKFAVRIDPNQLHRALLNILVNARDAMQGKGTLLLTVSEHTLDIEVSAGDRSLKPGGYVCISIKDSGSGIPEAIRERIFDPFFTTKSKEEGTGLGLASVYGIIARAGGFIDVDSREGEGATFNIFLPEMGIPGAGQSA